VKAGFCSSELDVYNTPVLAASKTLFYSPFPAAFSISFFSSALVPTVQYVPIYYIRKALHSRYPE
jgi:hypothetical protein